MTSKPTRVLFAALVLALVAYAAHAVAAPRGGPLDSTVNDWLYSALTFGGTALSLAGALRHRRERGAWLLISVGLLLWACGDLVWTLWLNDLQSPPYPSIADALYLGSYVAIYAGLVALLRARVRPLRPAQWVDGLVGGLAIAALAGALVFPTVAGLAQGDPLDVAVTLAYPVCDLLLLSFIVLAIGLNRWRLDASWLLLGLGQAVNAIADSIFTYQSAAGTYVAGGWVDALWPVGMVLTAAAVWQPRSRTVEDLGIGALPVTAAFTAAALGVLVADQLTTIETSATLLATCALIVAAVRGGLLFRDNLRLLEASRRDSLTDGLSGLPNRRALLADLEDAAAVATPEAPRTLALFDLDGFKQYNDAFGHAAGDALLKRLAGELRAAVAEHGTAYRLGGDEFCVLLEGNLDASSEAVEAALLALFEPADPYAVDASYGLVALPVDATTAAEALRVADHRMYALKHGRRATQGQAREVLLALLSEREPDLQRHMHQVAALSRAVGRELGLDAEDLDVVVRAAELHDIGKVAIPDTILNKPGPLDDDEWAFVHKHTLIGERIVSAAEALRPVGRVVRSSHERWDGRGYPDGLRGKDIPLGARIVLACDAWDAMTSDRTYRRALPAAVAAQELRANAGTQFDPDVAAALLSVVFDNDAVSATR